MALNTLPDAPSVMSAILPSSVKGGIAAGMAQSVEPPPRAPAPIVAWDINELRKYSGTRVWDAYYREMDKAYGQNQKWPSFRLWMVDRKEDPDAGTAPQS